MGKDIVIKQLDNGAFDVHYDGKHTEQLTFDEMLGVIAQLTVPESKHCLSWFKTPEQHQRERDLSRQSSDRANRIYRENERAKAREVIARYYCKLNGNCGIMHEGCPQDCEMLHIVVNELVPPTK